MGPFRLRLAIAALPVIAAVFAASATAWAGQDEPPWLGVGISTGPRGVLVIEIIRDTPADEAGLRVGDEIVAVAGARVVTPPELTQEITRHRVGDPVMVEVVRMNKRVPVPVVLGPRLDPDEIIHRRYVGQHTPNFEAEVVYGSDSGAVYQLRGHIVVLQLFSTSCQACLDQHSALSRLADEYASRGLVVLAVNGDRRDDIGAWAERAAPSFSVAYDPMGMVFRAFRVDNAAPALVVIDSAGVVRYAGIGGSTNLERATESVELLLRGERRAR